MDLIVISTPHQLLQIHELKKYFDIDNNKVILLIITLEPLDLYNVIDKTNYFQKFYMKTWSLRNPLTFLQYYPKFYRIINKIKKFGLINNFYSSQYYSDFSLLIFNKLKPKKIILLDEGTASFRIARDRMNYDLHKNKRSLIKTVIYNNSICFPDTITFFSQYEFIIPKQDRLVRYKFTKKNILGKLKDDTVMILGTSMVETNLISLDYYLYLLKRIVSSIKSKNIVYYPHRKENKNKLKIIEKIVDETMKNNTPFEYYYENEKNIPGKIISFASPVLTNLLSRYNLCPELVVCKFDINKLSLDKDIYKLIYDSYSKNKSIKIMNID